jgi:hypothetical protein
MARIKMESKNTYRSMLKRKKEKEVRGQLLTKALNLSEREVALNHIYYGYLRGGKQETMVASTSRITSQP